MAIGKYSRVDGRKSSSYCSTVTVVVFVALCLVGTWMFMSSSGVPVENSDLSSQVQNTDKVDQNPTRSTSKQSEDNSIDVSGDSNKDDSEEQRKYPENNDEEKSVTKSTDGNAESENSASENQEESHLKENADAASESNEEKKAEGENDGNREGGDLNSETGESKEGGETDKNEQTESAVVEKFKDQNGGGNNSGSEENDQTSNEDSTKSVQSESLSESNTQNGAWSTQAAESEKEKSQESSESTGQEEYNWKVCNTTAGPDYIPCLDNWQAIMKLRSKRHYEHRERHCPDEAPTCLVPLPEGYKRSISWPNSRDKIWYYNVPHTKLAEVKGHQNWVKVTGEYLTFPGGGTQFKNGALHYIDFIQSSVPDIAWGKRTHVILDVGCGVASFGGYLFERDVLAMSFAPKDEHEAQVQFALERGIPAILNVMGSKRLPFPGSIFDVVHCARCRVPWHAEGGKLLLELNRVLRPGGYFVWSATPVYQKLPEDVSIWKEMSKLTEKMCWELVTINEDKLNQVGAAIYRKPVSNECYDKRSESDPPLCEESDDPNAAWNIPLKACMHRVPEDSSKRGAQWPEQWPKRLETAPYWLENAPVGVYGKAASEDFVEDSKHWKSVVSNSYLSEVGINWSNVRNVMDMRAVYGGFAAALKDLKVWVMNVVPLHSADTLPIIYERGLFGMYHDWCESFNTYPRTYDLLHADHLFSTIRKRCNIVTVFAEVDRILRPEGNLLVRDDAATIKEVEKMARSLNWEVRATNVDEKEGFICFQKTFWRPNATETIEAAII